MLKLSNRRLEIVKANLNCMPNFKYYFGGAWFDKQINAKYHHPILFLLFDKEESSELADKLKILESKCDKFKRIIKKLKSDKDFNNFYSTLTEIDVISYYYKYYDKLLLEYEPSVKGGKKLDFKMNINGTDHFFEILTIFPDAEEEKYSDIRAEICQELEDLNLPYIIIIGMKNGFKKTYIRGFVDFIKAKIEKGNKKGLKINFYKNSELVADFRYYESDNDMCIVNSCGPPAFINPHGRLKEKVLTKCIEQIPNNQNNIVVVNLYYVLNIFLVIEQSLGELGIRIDKIDDLKDEYHRVPNGIFDYNDSSHILMIIAFINNDYEKQRRFYLNHKMNNLAKEKLIKTLNNF